MDLVRRYFGAISRCVVLMFLSLGTPLVLHADTIGFLYSDRAVTTFAGAGGYTWGAAINNQGTIAGTWKNGYYEGFTWSQGQFTGNVHYPGADRSAANGINDSGSIVGSYELPNQQYGHGFTSLNGTYTTLDYPGAIQTSLTGVNNSGTIVGTALLNGDYNGFVYGNGNFSLLNYPGAPGTILNSISNNGKIVGIAVSFGTFLYDDGMFTMLNFPQAVDTTALGVNSYGEVVGDFLATDRTVHGFIYQNGIYTQFDVPGASNTYISGINDLGQLTGAYEEVPEPSSLLLLSSAGGVLAFVRRAMR